MKNSFETFSPLFLFLTGRLLQMDSRKLDLPVTFIDFREACLQSTLFFNGANINQEIVQKAKM